MPGPAHKGLPEDEYWRPYRKASEPSRLEVVESPVCPRCRTEFVLGSRYCHMCGTERHLSRERKSQALAALKTSLGLSGWGLAAFLLGFLCMLAALLTPLFHPVRNAADWDAVQWWRTDWLLAAAAAFAAACAAKR